MNKMKGAGFGFWESGYPSPKKKNKPVWGLGFGEVVILLSSSLPPPLPNTKQIWCLGLPLLPPGRGPILLFLSFFLFFLGGGAGGGWVLSLGKGERGVTSSQTQTHLRHPPFLTMAARLRVNSPYSCLLDFPLTLSRERKRLLFNRLNFRNRKGSLLPLTHKPRKNRNPHTHQTPQATPQTHTPTNDQGHHRENPNRFVRGRRCSGNVKNSCGFTVMENYKNFAAASVRNDDVATSIVQSAARGVERNPRATKSG